MLLLKCIIHAKDVADCEAAVNLSCCTIDLESGVDLQLLVLVRGIEPRERQGGW